MNELELVNDAIPYEYPDAVAMLLSDIGFAANVRDQDGTEVDRLQTIISAISDLFSLEVPEIDENDPVETLRRIARDTKLANIARERAFYRLYLVTRTTKPGIAGTQVPLWYGMVDDATGEPLTTQEAFIRWFTTKSGLGRASTFRRISVYQRLAALGIHGKDAWLRVLRMPTVTQRLVGLLADWDHNEFSGVNRELALGVAKRVAADSVEELQTALDSDSNPEDVLEAYAPVVRALLDEADSYPSARNALEHIEVDIIGKPTVSYSWATDEATIRIRAEIPVVEGDEITIQYYETSLWVDDANPPDAVMRDLFARLPIVNKHDLPDY